MEQLELRNASESVHEAWWRRWRQAMQEEIDRIGLKEVAFQLNEKPSDILNGLAERDRHYFRGEWMMWLIGKCPALADLAAKMHGKRCEHVEPLTPEQENQRRKEATAKLAGPLLTAAIEAEVYADRNTEPFEKLK